MEAGVQAPINGLIQLANRGIGSEFIPPLQLYEKPLDAETGSAEWYCQQFGTGTGVLLDLVALRAAGRGIASRCGLQGAGLKLGLLRTEQVAAGEVVQRTFLGSALGSFALGATYEGVFRPVHPDEQHEFWSARFKNAISGGTTLATMDMSLRGTQPLANRLISNDRNFGLVLGRNLTVGGLAGFNTGVTNAVVRSALSDGEFRAKDILSSGGQYAFTGAILHGSPFLLNPVQKSTLNPERERRTLINLASGAGIGEDVGAQLALLEERAAKDGLSRQEIARTYSTSANFLRAESVVGVTREHLSALSLQCIRNAANPRGIDQGVNNTCNVTTIEGRLYSVSPSDAIRVVSNIALNGKFRTAGGTLISLDAGQLQPDEEARVTLKADVGSGKRLYASQLFQHGAVNSFWQTATEAPDGRTVKKGSLEYRVDAGRDAGNGQPAIPRREQIIDRSNGENEVIKLNGEVVNSPHLSLDSMLQVERRLTGRLERSRIVDYQLKQSTRDVLKPGSLDELKEQLTRLKSDKKFPVTLGMDVRADSFWKKVFGDRPIVVNSFRDTFYHVVQIVDYDPEKDKVYVDGSWGVGKDFLDKADGKPAMTVADVWSMMQDGSSKVTELRVSGNKDFSEEAVKVVSTWPHLNMVLMRDTKLTDVGLRNFRDNTELKLLDIAGTTVTNAGVGQITDLKKLERLFLSRTKVTADCLDQISSFPNLKDLDVAGTPIKPADACASADKLRHLKSIWFSAEMLTPAALREFGTALPGVQPYFCLTGEGGTGFVQYGHKSGDANRISMISVHEAPVGAAGKWFETLKNLPELEALYMTKSPLSEEEVGQLSPLTDLTLLSLDGARVTDAGLARLSGLNKLQHLSLVDGAVTGAGVENFAVLRSLILSGTKANDSALKNIDRLRQLEVLDLQDTKVTDDTISVVKRCLQLRNLKLSGTEITDAGVKQLGSLRNLSVLSLDRTKITHESMSALASMRLWSLSLDGTRISAAGLKALAINRSLQVLSLNGTDCDEAAATELGTMSNLTSLDLSRSTIAVAGIEKLSRLPSLHSCNLSETGISDTAIPALLRMPTYVLNVANTKISFDGITRLLSSRTLGLLTLSTDMCTEDQKTELRRRFPRVSINMVATAPGKAP